MGLDLGKTRCKEMIEAFGGRVTGAVSGKVRDESRSSGGRGPEFNFKCQCGGEKYSWSGS